MSAESDLPYEQAKNTEYLALLKAKLSIRVEYGLARSRIWVQPQPNHGRTYDAMHPLIGRVGLTDEDDLVGRSFYIGARHIDDGDLRVFSWAAPVAQLFYQPDGGEYEHVDPDQVAVRRTFDSHIDQLTDLDDEWVQVVEPSPFAAASLEVVAPSAPRRRRPAVAPKAPGAEPSGDERQPRERGEIPTALVAGMRSPDVVLRRIEAPRSDRLASVLATLQPDQHDLVSRSASQSLIVQGHPGTGKTIVAAYRAAHLVHPDASHGLERRVLLVGPTAGYVEHVAGLLQPLDPHGAVQVTHLEEFLAKTVGVSGTWSGSIGGEHDDVDGMARGLADAAMRLIGTAGLKTGKSVRRENIKTIYELVATNGTPEHPLVRNADQIAWMRKLPAFDKAFQLRRYLPLMAQCALAIQSIPSTDRFDHVIVDEAQDVSPIEWNVLDQYVAERGQWTLVGDMNQRRSDSTYATWRDISDHLGLGDEGNTLEPQVMSRGYRSTAPILRFGDKLLKSSERGAKSIQTDGAPVIVERVPAGSSLAAKAVTVAGTLARKHSAGTTAVITVDPGALIQALGAGGWRRKGGEMSIWGKDGSAVRIHVPESARGLEFDAVVVVEPSAFPENLGRTGQLYTSLTRANRELAVVWQSELPDALRRAARGR